MIDIANAKLTGPLFDSWVDYATVCGIAVVAMFITVFLIRFVATLLYFLLPIAVALLAVVVLNDPAAIQAVGNEPRMRYILPALVGLSGAGTFLFLGLFAFRDSTDQAGVVADLQQRLNNLRADVESLQTQVRSRPTL